MWDDSYFKNIWETKMLSFVATNSNISKNHFLLAAGYIVGVIHVAPVILLLRKYRLKLFNFEKTKPDKPSHPCQHSFPESCGLKKK